MLCFIPIRRSHDRIGAPLGFSEKKETNVLGDLHGFHAERGKSGSPKKALSTPAEPSGSTSVRSKLPPKEANKHLQSHVLSPSPKKKRTQGGSSVIVATRLAAINRKNDPKRYEAPLPSQKQKASLDQFARGPKSQMPQHGRLLEALKGGPGCEAGQI